MNSEKFDPSNKRPMRPIYTPKGKDDANTNPSASTEDNAKPVREYVPKGKGDAGKNSSNSYEEKRNPARQNTPKERDETSTTAVPPTEANSKQQKLAVLGFEKFVFLKFLYPQNLLDVLETNLTLNHYNNGVQIAENGSPDYDAKSKQLIRLNQNLAFCSFLVGYSPDLARAFRYSPHVKKVLKETNSHIVSARRYQKFRENLIKSHVGLQKGKNGVLDEFENEDYSYLVTYGTSVETVKQKLLDLGRHEGEGLEDTNQFQKFRREFKVSSTFDDEPVIDKNFIKRILIKYDKKVAITSRSDFERGKYNLSFALTSFTGPLVLESVEKELQEQFVYRKEIELNHFQHNYYKKVLYPYFKNSEKFVGAEIKSQDRDVDWRQICNKNQYVCRLSIQGLRKPVNRIYDELKNTADNLTEHKVEVPLKLNKEAYFEFKSTIIEWVNCVEQELDNVAFSNHSLVSEERTEAQQQQQQQDPNRKPPPQKSWIVLYAIGLQKNVDSIRRAADLVAESLFGLSYQFYQKSQEEVLKIIQKAGYTKLSELENGFEVWLKESIKKGKGFDPTLIYGRDEDVQMFKRFIEKFSQSYDAGNMTYQRILRRKSEKFLTRAIQFHVDVKFHPFKPKIYLIGNENSIHETIEFLNERVEDLKSQTQYVPVSAYLLSWMDKAVNVSNVRYFEREHKVLFILPDSPKQGQNEYKLGVVGTQQDNARLVEDLTVFAFGNVIEREIKLPTSFNMAPNQLANRADKFGLEVRIRQNTLVLKGLTSRIQQFKESELRFDPRVDRGLYPKYWDFIPDSNDSFKKVEVKESSAEYKNIADLFLRTMEKIKITKLERIQNQYLMDKFIQSSTNTNGSKIFLFYSHKQVDPAQVYEDFEVGFDLQFSNDERREGFYFTLDANEAHRQYGYNVEKNAYKMVLADVVKEKGKKTINKGGAPQYYIEDGSLCYPLYLIEYEK